MTNNYYKMIGNNSKDTSKKLLKLLRDVENFNNEYLYIFINTKLIK